VSLTGRIRVFSIALVFLAARAVFAQSPPWDDPQWVAEKGMDERFGLHLGGFFQNFRTTLALGPASGGSGTDINLERDLGLGNQTSFSGDGYWRFGRHGRFDFGYRGWTRKNTHTLERDIEFGDHTYVLGASVDFRQHTDVFNIAYGYSFINNPKVEFGLRLGVSAQNTKSTMSASATVGGNTSSISDERSLFTPFPVIGAYGSATLMPRFFVTAEVAGLPSVTLSNYTVSFIDAKGGLEYFFSKNVGVGVNYEYVKATVSRNITRTIDLSYRYSGPIAYLSLAF
jgi:hypothetical protein